MYSISGLQKLDTFIGFGDLQFGVIKHSFCFGFLASLHWQDEFVHEEGQFLHFTGGLNSVSHDCEIRLDELYKLNDFQIPDPETEENSLVQNTELLSKKLDFFFLTDLIPALLANSRIHFVLIQGKFSLLNIHHFE